ncbi:MAG: 1,4-dihydroxy-2-naphthoate octaprenyltransferase [Saprospiraceae bacterium]|jgi:1,4-dihydroxy-2-naphthoate octaprenyltransferase
MNIKVWLAAFRLRTLPLAFSSIITGSAIAYYHFSFNGFIFGLALLTTLFLQVLSNLANDYGDSEHGADNADRIGPARTVQSGAISKRHMKIAMVIFSVLALASGIPLIIKGTKNIDLKWFLFFLALGMGSIAAAIKYTAGKNPYGYKGLGDVFVFIFFGLVGVIGTFILQYQHINRFLLIESLFPAIAMGCFSAAVLNMNNMRDHLNDKNSGKITLAVRLGTQGSKIYHVLLILTGMASMYYFGYISHFGTTDFLLLSIPDVLFVVHLVKVLKVTDEKKYDPELKKIALTTFLLSLVLMAIMIKSF